MTQKTTIILVVPKKIKFPVIWKPFDIFNPNYNLVVIVLNMQSKRNQQKSFF